MGKKGFDSNILKSFGSNVPSSNDASSNSYNEGEYIPSEEKRRINMSQWGLIAPNKFGAIPDTEKKLQPGAYDINRDEQTGQIFFSKKSLIHDKLINLSGLPKEIIDEIKEFWNKEKVFSDLGFLHRRGYILYGNQGVGKTSLVYEIVKTTIEDGGIVFYCDNPSSFNKGLILFRQVEPERKAVCVFEDIDAIIKNYGESMLLSVLDGENQISRVCNIATTNYPEALDKRIVGRPRRFDRVYRIGNLDDKARLAFLEKKLPAKQDVKDWLKKTKNLSIAAISEVMISVFCFGKKIEDAVEIMKSLQENKSSSSDDSEKLGFVSEE